MTSEKYTLNTIKEIGKLSDDGLLVYDLEGNKVVYCNKALSKILEKPKDQIVEGGIKLISSSLKDDKAFILQLTKQFKADLKISNVELRVVSAKAKYVSVDAYLIEDPQLIVALVKDITKSKQHMDYIVEFGAIKDTLLDGISQRLAGPLNLTNNLLDVLDQVSTEQRYRKIEQPARLIRENTQECIEVINAFLREEHVTSPAIPVGSNRFNVLTKIKTVVDRYEEFNPTKDFKIVTRKPELFATGDDVKFFQIINNLVSNSVKFTNEKGKITVEVIEADSAIVINVKDNGIGIPEYLQPHIFKKNSPAARPGLRGEKSIGLGLYIIGKLAALMSGTISFESEEGKGSVFTFTLPKAVID